MKVASQGIAAAFTIAGSLYILLVVTLLSLLFDIEPNWFISRSNNVLVVSLLVLLSYVAGLVAHLLVQVVYRVLPERIRSYLKVDTSGLTPVEKTEYDVRVTRFESELVGLELKNIYATAVLLRLLGLGFFLLAIPIALYLMKFLDSRLGWPSVFVFLVLGSLFLFMYFEQLRTYHRFRDTLIGDIDRTQREV